MRKFGVEIELNSFDQRDFKKYPLGKNEYPSGIDYVCSLIKNLGFMVRIDGWHQTHNNFDWVCKSDSSCGMEICSPASDNLESVLKLIDVLSKDSYIKIDNRCSFHVHFDISDCISKKGYQDDFYNSTKLASILSWWVKCEPVFFDSIPDHRKFNKYCQCIGISEIFKADEKPDYFNVIQKLGSSKYFSCNVYHLCKGSRPTIEFRLAEESACVDPIFAKNWVVLLSRFIEQAVSAGVPDSYCWLDTKQVFEFLGFNKNLSFEEKELRYWFLNRILKNIKSNVTHWNYKLRRIAILESEDILRDLQLDKDISSSSVPMDK
jgi:hypothetical protein